MRCSDLFYYIALQGITMTSVYALTVDVDVCICLSDFEWMTIQHRDPTKMKV